MSRIKTREAVRDNKLLDRSAVVGQRMKSAFIRSKKNAAVLMDDSQATPSEYAGDKVQLAADDIAHDTVNVAVSGTKSVVRQGKERFQRQMEKKAWEKWQEDTAPISQTQTPSPEPQPSAVPERQYPQSSSGTALERRLPQQRTDTVPERRFPRQHTDAAPERKTPWQRSQPRQRCGTIERSRLPDRVETECISDAIDPVEERGRTRAKNQAAKRANTQRKGKERTAQSTKSTQPQTKVSDAARAPQQIESSVRQTVNATQKSTETARQPGCAVRQTTKSVGRTTARTVKGTVKNVQRTVKTPQQTAKGTVKVTEHTSRAAVRPANHTKKTAHKTMWAATKAAQQRTTGRTARTTARTTFTTAKRTTAVTANVGRAAIAALKALSAALTAGGWLIIPVVIFICMIGPLVGSCFGIFFSGEDSGTGQTMPAVVREIDREYAGKLEEAETSYPHDVLEISGSRATWPEVLAIYAVRTTTDPDNALEVATMDKTKKELLREIFWAMNDINCRTETRTITISMEVDDGEGNIETEEVPVSETTLYVTVTHKTANDMADVYHFNASQRRQLAELLAEENHSMWNAVLFGVGTGDGEMVAVALAQIGNIGGEPYWSWYGFSSRVDWCACFVSWCADQCGYIDVGVLPKFASCAVGIRWFQDRGLWQDRSYTPQLGDLVFFDWDDDENGQDGKADHVGIVARVENGRVYTVEGNSNDICRERSYPLGYYEIFGYGSISKGTN